MKTNEELRNTANLLIDRERVVNGIEICRGGFMTVRSGTTVTVFLSDLGETVFLTREEAERALNSSDKSNS